HESLKVLVARDLAASTNLWSTARLSAVVIDALDRRGKCPQPIRLTSEKSPYVDAPFQSFIETVFEKYSAISGKEVSCNGALISGLQSFVSTMLEYMRPIYDVLDELLLDDFRRSLFKALAFNIGIGLAVGVGRGSPKTKLILQELCTD